MRAGGGSREQEPDRTWDACRCVTEGFLGLCQNVRRRRGIPGCADRGTVDPGQEVSRERGHLGEHERISKGRLRLLGSARGKRHFGQALECKGPTGVGVALSSKTIGLSKMLLCLVQLSGEQLSLSEHRRGESGAANGARPVGGGSELARERSDLLIRLGAVQRELDEAQVRVEDRASESWVPSRVEHVAAHAVPELTAAVAHHAEKPGRLGRDANESDVAGQTACLLRRGLRGGEIFVVPGDESTSEKERRSVTRSRRFYAVQRCLCRGCVARREVCARLPDPK